MSPNHLHLRFVYHLAENKFNRIVGLTVITGFSLAAFAQQPTPPKSDPAVASASPTSSTAVTLPSGTRIALVLMHPIQSRYVHRGDDIYAQIVSPVTSGDEVIIPGGTPVDGKVDRFGRNGSRGELYLQSATISFPDGYAATVAGPITLESNEGYALKDPGKGRVFGAVALPLAGAGLGALIGHAAASSQPNTITSSLPPGCMGPPPGCLTSSLTTPAEKGKDTVIGAAVGGGIGFVASLLLANSSRHFFLDVGSPVEMTLPHSLTLERDQVAEAIRDAEQHPAG